MKRGQDQTVFILSILLGIFFVVLFYDKGVGVSYTIFTLMVLLFYAIVIRDQGCQKWYIHVGSSYIFLLSTIFVRSDFFLFKVLNFLAIPILIGVHLAIYAGEKEVTAIIKGAVSHLLMPISKLHTIVLYASRTQSIDKQRQEKIKKVLLGVLIVTPILFIVIPLMLSADAVFAHKISVTTGGIEGLLESQLLIKIVIGVLVAAYLFGQIYNIHQEIPQKPIMIIKEREDVFVFQGFDRTITATFITVLDAIYVFFCGIQVIYLFGGGKLPDGYTYASYAREGFFQLVVLSVINVLIVLIINRFYLGYKLDPNASLKGRKTDALISSLLSVMVTCTGIMIISSLFRMQLYEMAYGSTRLRLIVFLFLLFEAVTLAIVLYSLWHRRFPLAKIIVYVMLISYLIVNFINIDGIVAKRNIDRYIQTGKLDTLYLEELSADALKQMKRLRESDPDVYKRYIHEVGSHRTTHWQAFNLSEYKAYEYVKTSGE